jgi:hypothetical protein
MPEGIFQGSVQFCWIHSYHLSDFFSLPRCPTDGVLLQPATPERDGQDHHRPRRAGRGHPRPGYVSRYLYLVILSPLRDTLFFWLLSKKDRAWIVHLNSPSCFLSFPLPCILSRTAGEAFDFLRRSIHLIGEHYPERSVSARGGKAMERPWKEAAEGEGKS